ncbi:carboxypeptidase-like regulatory domain-containing protein [Candidatus Palauibacter soopunensis]|uniref:carboxypeptidase-like regulatory domain-containing protein n=1 Tax=Candidatus Palauibacter soopunensis TaxID=3056739 RepID=UPI0023A4C676|nr:carboxypeptidase-like regulatory domain-containing protein [Candidatus Palauibacter soopunensis]MDE2879358.1 carboxypeptidase-like regulatory domain-containing protein [Candidatus Palauibacter soopunensis]
MRYLLVALAWWSWIAAPVAAQTISGTVRETNGGPLISGGFVSLLDASDEAVQADFTAADGVFSLRAPGPGTYRIRVERIGYADWVTASYELAPGQRLAVTVEILPRPVRLGDLRVEVTGSCLDDPSQGAELATVWEEARKALETAVWAEGRGELTFTLREYQRTLDPRHLTTLEVESRTRRHVRLPPFRSLPASRLVASGYAFVDADSAVFYAPDATVLLSPEFRDTQCFGLERAEVDDEPMLGITFRPRHRRRVIDVEGTLWLDEESAELRRVQIRYRNVPLPRNARRQHIGADLTFDRLPNGPFYVRDWWVRFPIGSRSSRFRAGLSGRPDPVLVAYRQTGGTVTDAFAGGVSFEVGEGAVTGVLRDSVSGGPLAGAEIVVRDWDDAAAFLPRPAAADVPFSAVTDEEGGFQVAGLPDGVYALGVYHPKLRAAGVRINETRVVVEDRTSDPLELWTPSDEALFARVCPGSSPYGSTGAVVGFARDADTGLPVPDIEVEVVWRVRRLQGTARTAVVSEQSQYAGGVSDERGRFAICDVPLGERVVLRPRGLDEGVELELVTRLAWRDVLVEP